MIRRSVFRWPQFCGRNFSGERMPAPVSSPTVRMCSPSGSAFRRGWATLCPWGHFVDGVPGHLARLVSSGCEARCQDPGRTLCGVFFDDQLGLGRELSWTRRVWFQPEG